MTFFSKDKGQADKLVSQVYRRHRIGRDDRGGESRWAANCLYDYGPIAWADGSFKAYDKKCIYQVVGGQRCFLSSNRQNSPRDHIHSMSAATGVDIEKGASKASSADEKSPYGVSSDPIPGEVVVVQRPKFLQRCVDFMGRMGGEERGIERVLPSEKTNQKPFDNFSVWYISNLVLC